MFEVRLPFQLPNSLEKTAVSLPSVPRSTKCFARPSSCPCWRNTSWVFHAFPVVVPYVFLKFTTMMQQMRQNYWEMCKADTTMSSHVQLLPLNQFLFSIVIAYSSHNTPTSQASARSPCSIASLPEIPLFAFTGTPIHNLPQTGSHFLTHETGVNTFRNVVNLLLKAFLDLPMQTQSCDPSTFSTTLRVLTLSTRPHEISASVPSSTVLICLQLPWSD